MVFKHLPRVPLYSVVVNIMKFFTATTGIRTPIAVKIKHANHYTIGLVKKKPKHKTSKQIQYSPHHTRMYECKYSNLQLELSIIRTFHNSNFP